MRGKKGAPGDLGRGNRQLGRELVSTAKRGHLDPPIEDAALPGAEVAGHAGIMRCAQPLWDDDVADLRADGVLARHAEYSLCRRVKLENDPLIVSRDNAVESAFENPAKAPLAVAQRRDRLVMRDRDADQPRGRAQRLQVQRLPGTFLDAIVKADRPPP